MHHITYLTSSETSPQFCRVSKQDMTVIDDTSGNGFGSAIVKYGEVHDEAGMWAINILTKI